MITAMQAAKHACETSGWQLTNLQLQKILYIAHMIYSGREGSPVLVHGESFQAWDYGPVLPSVYRHVSAFGSRSIGNVFHSIADSDDDDARGAIRTAVNSLAQVPPFKLVEIVHDEYSAWRRHYRAGERHTTIPQEDIVAEYRSRFAANA